MDGSARSANDGLRRDASKNREKLLDAARAVFADHGTEAPLEAIASAAGVGIATLYRRFPTREDLLAVIVSEEIEEYLRVLREALEHDDAWLGFRYLLERMFQLQARHPGLCHAPFMRLPDADALEEGRAELLRLAEELITRAKGQGSLRADASAQDVMLASWGNSGVITNAPGRTPGESARYLELILDAFKAR